MGKEKEIISRIVRRVKSWNFVVVGRTSIGRRGSCNSDREKESIGRTGDIKILGRFYISGHWLTVFALDASRIYSRHNNVGGVTYRRKQ